MMKTSKPMISACIISFNEEQNIEECLKSLEHVADEIIVVDSLSTDRTVEIANEEFYRPKDLDAFNETVEEIVAAAPDLADADPKAVDAAMRSLIGCRAPC